MIALLALVAQASASPVPSEQVMTCYLQKDDLSKRDPQSPNRPHLVGPKYLIAWKFKPQASHGRTFEPTEVHDPHGFLQGNSFGEQIFDSQGTLFFAGEPSKDIYMVGVLPDKGTNGAHKAQFIHSKKQKIAGMAFGCCKADERNASEAFSFWKSQADTLP